MIPAPLVGPALTDPQSARPAQPVPTGTAPDAFARLLAAAGLRPDAATPDLPVVPTPAGAPIPEGGAASSGEQDARTPAGAAPRGEEGGLTAPPSGPAEPGEMTSPGSTGTLLGGALRTVGNPVAPIGGPATASPDPLPMPFIAPEGGLAPAPVAAPAPVVPPGPVPDRPVSAGGDSAANAPASTGSAPAQADAVEPAPGGATTPFPPEQDRIVRSATPLPQRAVSAGSPEVALSDPGAGEADAIGLISRPPLNPGASPPETGLSGDHWDGRAPLPDLLGVRVEAAPVAPDPVRAHALAGTGRIAIGTGPVPDGDALVPVTAPDAGVGAKGPAPVAAPTGAAPDPAAVIAPREGAGPGAPASGGPAPAPQPVRADLGAPVPTAALAGGVPTDPPPAAAPPPGGPGAEAAQTSSDAKTTSAPEPAPIRRMSPIEPVSGSVLTGWSRPGAATGVGVPPAPVSVTSAGALPGSGRPATGTSSPVQTPGPAPTPDPVTPPAQAAPAPQAGTMPVLAVPATSGPSQAVAGPAQGPVRTSMSAAAPPPARSDVRPPAAAQVTTLGGPVDMSGPVTADPPPSQLTPPPPLSPTAQPQTGLTLVRKGASQPSPASGAPARALTSAPGPVPVPQFDPVRDGPAPTTPWAPSDPISGGSPMTGPAGSGAAAEPSPPLSTLLADRTALSRHVTRQVRLPSDGEARTQITLRPDGLGTVEVELSTDPNGRLSLLLRVENPTVLQALRADRDGLLMSLERSGLDLGGAQLGFEGFGPGRDPDRDERRPGPYRMTQAAPTEGPSGPAASPRRTPLIGGGRVDLLT